MSGLIDSGDLPAPVTITIDVPIGILDINDEQELTLPEIIETLAVNEEEIPLAAEVSLNLDKEDVSTQIQDIEVEKEEGGEITKNKTPPEGQRGQIDSVETKISHPILLHSGKEDKRSMDIQSLLRTLETTKDKEKQKEYAQALIEVSKTGTGKVTIIENMNLLVSLLNHNDEDVIMYSLQMINTVGASTEAKSQFLAAEGFPVLVFLFGHSNPEIQILALNAVGYLITRDINNARELKEAGGIPPLILFLGHDSSQSKFFAAACAWVLAAYQDDFQDALLEAGAIPLLFQLLNEGHEDISWQAAGALRNIVVQKNSRVHDAILEADGLDKYALALQQDTELSERVLGLIIQTLVIISSSEVVKEASGTEKIITLLLDRLQAVDSLSEIHSRMLYILTNFCTKNKKNQDTAREGNGIQIIFSLFNDSTPDTETIRSDAATALWALSIQNEENISLLLEASTFLSLHQCLLMETERVLVGIVATIGNIASSSKKRQDFLQKKGIIPLILDFLRGSYEPLLDATAGTIMSLIRDNTENIKYLLAWDGPLLLAKKLATESSLAAQNILGSLRLLLEAQFVKTMRAIRSENGVKIIIRLAQETGFPQLQINAAYCLCSMVEHNARVREEFIASGAENFLIVGLSESSSNKLTSVFCDITQYLASSDVSFRLSFTKTSKVMSILHHIIETKKESHLLLEKAIKAIWSLCLNNPTQQQNVRQNGWLHTLLDLYMEEDARIRTKTAVLKTIAAVCSKNYKNQEIVRLFPGCLTRIVASLRIGYTVPDLGSHAALAVWCLSMNHSKMKTAFRGENGLIPLVEVMKRNQTNLSLIINALGALTVLIQKSSSNRQILKEYQTPQLLSSLATNMTNSFILEQINDLLTSLS